MILMRGSSAFRIFWTIYLTLQMTNTCRHQCFEPSLIKLPKISKVRKITWHQKPKPLWPVRWLFQSIDRVLVLLTGEREILFSLNASSCIQKQNTNQRNWMQKSHEENRYLLWKLQQLHQRTYMYFRVPRWIFFVSSPLSLHLSKIRSGWLMRRVWIYWIGLVY